ncbi:MAG: hypothetical protein JSS96_02900 [Bacteroidetes bacterium]|nr:hypothetical protein [Bacteroidota bacterium]
MSEQNDILIELEQLGSALANMSRKMPYEVPTGYFEGLSSSIQENTRLSLQQDPVLSISKEIPQAVPDDYFKNLPSQILQAAKLNDIPKTLPYAVPQAYFENLPAEVLHKAKGDDNKQDFRPTRIIAFSGNLRWAAAALLLLCLSIGSYEFLHTRATSPEKALAKVPQANLKEYIRQNIDDFDAEMIVSNLQSTDIHNVQVSSKQLDEQEIIQYLNETGWDADAGDSKANNKLD